MYKHIAVFLVFLFSKICDGDDNTGSFETPEYIKPCRRTDPNINTCLRGTFEHLRPYLVTGLKDINLPSVDPLVIDKLVMENGQGPFRIKAVFSNVTAYGGSNYSIGTIKADIRRYTIELTLKLPKVDIRGKYDVGGNVLLFPVRSKGDFWAIFVNVDVYTKIYGKEMVKNNVKYMKIDRLNVDFKFSKSRFRVRDVINDGNIIGEAMNQFLNNNANEIIAEMKPAATASISRHFKAFLNNAFLRLPIEVWLPDS